MFKLTVFLYIVLTLLSVTTVAYNRIFNDKVILRRLRREAIADPESTTHHPEADHTPSDEPVYTNFQEQHADTSSYDQGSIDHHHSDIGYATGRNEGQSEITNTDLHSNSAHQGDHQSSDSGQNNEYGSYPDTHSNARHPEHSTGDITGDYHNPLHMSRPGEAPPRFMSNVQQEQPLQMPRALPLIQDPSSPDTGVDGSQADLGQMDRTGDLSADPSSTENYQDTPSVLPQTQDYIPDTGRLPIALPQKQGTPDPTLDKPSQGHRSKPRPRPREPPNHQSGVRDTGSDLLATAAILNTDVHDTVQDTVSDGMEIIAKQQAIDHLDRQLSGTTRDTHGRGRLDTREHGGPNWGGTGQPSAPRRSSSRSGSHGDPLDTLARVHTMKTQADLVQDHVDTVHDIHQDRTDYMYGSRDYDPRYDPRYGQPYNSHYDSRYDRYYRGNPNSGSRFPSNHNFESPSNHNFESRRPYDSYPPYPPYYRGAGDRHDGHPQYHRANEDGYQGYNGYNGYQPGFKLDINSGMPCSNMSDPRCRAQGYQEIQIETPHGEMDMEPGELDLEGPVAADLLRMLGFAQSPSIAPGQQEININHNVLAALRSKFGINNTADIRRMSSNRQFQAFMYQVLTHAGQIAPGEYNANLTKAEVDRLLAHPDTSRSRLRTANLDHARLNITPPRGGANDTSQSEAVLTIDGGPAPNNMNIGLPGLGGLSNLPGLASPLVPGLGGLSNLPGFASPLVQNENNMTEEVAQPGSVAALVQTMLGGGAQAGEEKGGGEAGEGRTEGQGSNGTQALIGGEAGEGHEGGHTINGTNIGESSEASNTTVNTTVHNSTIHPLNVSSSIPQKSIHIHEVSETAGPGAGTVKNISILSNTTLNPPLDMQQVPKNTSITKKETDIMGKDGNTKLSKDAITKSEKPATKVNSNSSTEARSKVGTASAAGTPEAGAGGSATIKGAGQGGKEGLNGVQGNSQPTGLAEAGIDPIAHGAEPKNTIPTEAIERSYKASTAFAIVSATMIALAFIIGPILCLLCKMKEKAEQKKRKEKAMKNRDVSENNIRDSMMLNDFGPEAPNFVANEAEAAVNYYKTDYKSEKQYYDISEIETLKPNRHSLTGNLP